MFKNYKDEGHIVGIKEQHNIMIFIGNGIYELPIKNSGGV